MKKILLIIAITLCIFQMIVLAISIDIGSPAINRNTSFGVFTLVERANPANADGIITSIEIWAYQILYNCEVATFFVVSGNYLSTRDTEAIGTVTAGSKQTFNVNLDVESGDYIGIYYTTGNIEANNSGGVGVWYIENSDRIPCTNMIFSSVAGYILSLYGTGTTGEEEANSIFFGMNF